MLKPLRLLFLLLMCLPMSVYAQTNFRKGYIVQPNGDTLRGEVDYRGAQRSAYVTRFRQQGQVVEYTPTQLRGYGFPSDRIYQSEAIQMADSSKQVVFLEVMVAGPVSLLYLRNRDGADLLYLRDTNDKLQALTQTTKRVEVNGALYDQKDKAFQRTLAVALVACPAVQPTLSRLTYTTHSIADVVRQYNRCVSSSPHEEVASVEKHVVLEAAIVAGGMMNQLRFSSDVNYANTAIRSGIIPMGGVAAHMWLPGLNKHLAVRMEALYMAKATYKHTQERLENTYSVLRETRAQLSSIRIPVFVRYSWPGKRIQPFVQVGVSGNYLLNTTNETRYRYLDRSAFPDYYPWRAIIEQPRRFEQGVVGSIGLSVLPANKHALSVELRYERTNGFSDALAIATRLSYYSILMSYNLTKHMQ